ncbi:MAG TPA: HNH endonuclease [Clostridium sp.]|nr:HNH endonuclease [Clostridium sp.]
MNSELYHSSKWKSKRAKILRRDGYMCQLSLRYGKRIDADTVHHIYPVENYPEYAFCDWNLISLSSTMHNKLHDRITNKLTDLGNVLKNKTIPPHLSW